ncbi:MAG TPA: hypothetical protein VLH13_03230, partial [Methanomassiliicoccales archaeon]|nr:hypothetical protein [Methanomassiliicoccales archaeon]
KEVANSTRDRYAPVAMGLLSLGLGIFLIMDLPDALDLLLRGIGVLAILAGAMQTMAGVCAWNRTKNAS